MRSSRLHWHRPTRRRTPSAGVVRPAGFGWLGIFIHALQAGPAGDGSQKPGDGEHLSPVKAGRDTPREGANRVQHVLKAEPAGADATDREARSKVMALEGSDSPTGRGTSGAPAVSAAPVFHSPLLFAARFEKAAA